MNAPIRRRIPAGLRFASLESRVMSSRRRSDLRGRPRRAARRGAALVEFAVVVPVLLLFVLGMIEISRAIMVTDMLAFAARHGSRQAVLGSSTTASVQSSVKQVLTDAGIRGATVSVLVNGANTDVTNAKTGDAITVETTVPYANVTWLSAPKYLDGKSLNGRVVMRRE